MTDVCFGTQLLFQEASHVNCRHGEIQGTFYMVACRFRTFFSLIFTLFISLKIWEIDILISGVRSVEDSEQPSSVIEQRSTVYRCCLETASV